VADLYIPVPEVIVKPDGRMTRELQLFLQKLVATVGAGTTGTVIKAPDFVATDAEIAASPTTPIDIMEPLGIGSTIMPILVTMTSNFVVAYTGIDPGFPYCQINYSGGDLWSGYLADDSSTVVPLTNFTDFFGVTTRLRVPFTRFLQTTDIASEWGALANAITLNDNTGLQFSMFNGGTGDLTGGDPDNTLTFTTYYVEEVA
jgi:hypothetical protein